MTQEEIHNIFQNVHQAWPISLAGTAIIGLVLWLMGRKMIRPAMAICGIFIGAAIGFTLSHEYQANDGLLLTWTGVGAVAGALAVWLLYRAWMAISLGLLAVVIVPATAIAFTGTPDPNQQPTPHPATSTLVDQSPKSTDAPSTLIGKGDGTKTGTGNRDGNATDGTDGKDGRDGQDGKDGKDGNTTVGLPGVPIGQFAQDQINQFTQDQIDAGIEKGKEVISDGIEKGKEAINGLIDAIRASFEHQSAYIDEWWQAMDDGQRKSLLTTTAIGVGIALLIGFMLPNVAASIETAFIGTVMLFIATRGILATYSGAELTWLSKPQQIFITIGLITILGILLQWTFFRNAADK